MDHDHDAKPTARGTISPESIPSTGLSVVYEPPNDEPVVDIVMVHGLKGHPYKTWRFMPSLEKVEKPSTQPDPGALKPKSSKRVEFRNSFKAWMKGSSSKDCLEQGMIKSPHRIVSSASTVESSVFFCIRRMTVPGRPLIFVAHSLGGILVKEMLALSWASDTASLKGIVECTAAIIFLGTPHRGSPELSAIGEWARSILDIFPFQTTSAILDILGLKTTDLERGHEAFSRLWLQYDFRVKTFQEGFGLTGIKLGVLGNKVVPHDSSLIGDPREHAETLQANHMEMSRFRSAHDPNFIKVAGELMDIYTGIESEHVHRRTQSEGFGLLKEASLALKYGPRRQQQVMDKKMLSTLIEFLRFDGMNTRRECISPPSLNTGQWLFRNAAFNIWKMSTQSSERLLFVKGKLGAGKSTLMKEAVRQTKSECQAHGCCASFFINARSAGLEGTSGGMLRSLLCQLLIYCESLSMNTQSEPAITLTENLRGKAALKSKEWGDPELESLLTDVLAVFSLERVPVYIFVDALDELGSHAERHVVTFWTNLVLSQGFRKTRICLSYLVQDTPIELEEVYAQTIGTLTDGERIIALRLFQWATEAARPLRLDEWHHILAFIAVRPPTSLKEWRESITFTENDYQLERKIRTLSRGLLEISNSQFGNVDSEEAGISSIHAGAGSLDHEQGSARVVQVIHESVYGFLMFHGGFKILGWNGDNALADCHCMIAITCLNYMNIPELDDLVIARRRQMMADSVTSSERSSFWESQQDILQGEPVLGPERTLDGLLTLPEINPYKSVESWVANEHLLSYSSSLGDAADRSAVSVPATAKSQALQDYPALLLYAASELYYHARLADSATFGLIKVQLDHRLNDEELKERLVALHTKMWSKNYIQDVKIYTGLSYDSST
ncbi:hypothetical protein FNAPI_10072 [Fusarium napiforme]|uniref:Nephrocystin 3-like N-terminal domain-containing protein n=1 Tax=Fusarium napiforme TaxID=42672 RepID=A0A8H5IU81_9HYPO|nr:hypothetical protein FNAPI_10072 [Fusarium napiforme]